MKTIKQIKQSLSYAVHGWQVIFREERNFRLELAVAFLVVVAALVFKKNVTEWCLLIFAIGLVLTAEILNSAMERLSDALKPRIDAYVKTIKDILASAVLFCSCLAVLIGLLIFSKDFIGLLRAIN